MKWIKKACKERDQRMLCVRDDLEEILQLAAANYRVYFGAI